MAKRPPELTTPRAGWLVDEEAGRGTEGSVAMDTSEPRVWPAHVELRPPSDVELAKTRAVVVEHDRLVALRGVRFGAGQVQR